jgi:hypothetical protein
MIEVGSKYYTIGLFKGDLIEEVTFRKDMMDIYLLKKGLVFKTREEAQDFLNSKESEEILIL